MCIRDSAPAVHHGVPSAAATVILAFDDPIDTAWKDDPSSRASYWRLACGLHTRPALIHSGTVSYTHLVPQKQLPKGAPDWIATCPVSFPRFKRTVRALCVTVVAHVLWAVPIGTVEFHPWNSRRADVEKPDEWRIDLDPMPQAGFAKVRAVAGVVAEVLDELGIVGFPKTTGGGGLHVYVRILSLIHI